MTDIKGFWSTWEYVKNPRTGKKLVQMYLDPYSKDEAFVFDAPVYYGYVWKGRPVLRQTKTWFQFSPSTPFLSRLIHDPREGRHIAQSFFHDDAYGKLDEEWAGKVEDIATFTDIYGHLYPGKFLTTLSEWPDTTIPLDPTVTREEADELWRAVGEHFKADELDEEITFLGLRIGGGVFHWMKNSKLGKMVGL